MADTEISTVLTGDTTGFVQSLKNADKGIETTIKKLGEIDAQVALLTEHINALGKIDLNKMVKSMDRLTVIQNSHDINLSKGQSYISKNGTQVAYNPNNTSDVEKAGKLTDSIVKETDVQLKEMKAQTALIRAKSQALRLDNKNYETLLALSDKRKTAEILNAKARVGKANYKNSRAASENRYDDALAMKHQTLQGFYKYKSEHPERFATLRGTSQYEITRNMSEFGDFLQSKGALGKIAGVAIQTAANGMISPIAGIAYAAKEASKGLVDFANASVDAYKEIESIKTQLSVVTGSNSQANALFGSISDYAVKSPFGVEQTSELAVLLRQSGVYASDLMDTLKMIGDTAGGDMERMKRIANNYAQIVSIGKASMLDMRQFAYAGIPIFEAVSKELNVSQSELRKLISDGKVTSDIIEKVFKDLTGVNGIFNKATSKGAKTLKARVQNLNDMNQLMLASFGERFTQMGRSITGNGEGFVYNALSITESVSNALKNWREFNNLTNDVKDIKRKKGGANEYSIDEERAKFSDFFIKGNEDLERDKEIRDRYGKFANEKNALIFTQMSSTAGLVGSVLGGLYGIGAIAEKLANALPVGGDYKSTLLQEMYNEQVKKNTSNWELFGLGLRDMRHAFEGDERGKEGYEYRYNQDMVLKSQDNFFTQVDKLASSNNLNINGEKTDSVINQANEIKSIVENSEKFKKEQEQKRLEELKNTQMYLRNIQQYLSPRGVLQLSADKVGGYILDNKKFLEMLNKGALTPSMKYQVVNDNLKLSAEQRPEFQKDLNWSINAMKEYLQEGRNKFGDKLNFGNVFKSIANYERYANTETTDITKYLKNFNTGYVDFEKEINKALEAVKGDKEKTEFMNNLIKLFKSPLLQYESSNKYLDADLDELISKGGTSSGNIGIPLWKRILSQYTGLSANNINGTKETLQAYQENVAPRNMYKNLSRSMLEGGRNFDDVRNLLAITPEGSRLQQNRNDTSKTWQIDWKETQKRMKEFCNSLKATSTEINAYKTSLESQLDTYVGLTAALAEMESTDINGSKTVSAKKWNELTKDMGDQLINAFGESLVTTDGIKVKAVNPDGSIIGDDGLKYEGKQLTITGNLMDFLKKEIPALRNEISDMGLKGSIRSAEEGIRDTVNRTDIKTSLVQALGGDSKALTVFEKSNIDPLETMKAALKSNYKTIIKDDITLEDVITSLKLKDDSEIIDKVKELKEIKDKEGDLPDTSEALVVFYEKLLNNVAKKIKDNGLSQEVYDSYLNDESKNNALLNKLSINKQYGSLTPNPHNPRDRIFNEKLGKVGLAETSAYAMGELYQKDFIKNYPSYNPETNNYKEVSEYLKLNGVKTLCLGSLETHSLIRDFNKNASLAEDETLSQEERDSYLAKAREDAEAIKNSLNGVEFATELANANVAGVNLKNTIANMDKELYSLAETTAKDTFLTPFETMGECLLSSDEYSESLSQNMSKIAAQTLQSLGSIMAKAGFEIAAAAAAKNDWAGVAGGLGLAAAGGFASGLGNSIANAAAEEDEEEDKAAKLESLSDQIANLLEQARTDALYYENNLRHKKALGLNKSFSNKVVSVNDAVITPSGTVVKTDPKDYLIASKTPRSLVGGGSANVSVVVNNNSSAQVRTKQNVSADGSVQIVAFIEETVGNYISSARSDNAFGARDARQRGTVRVMS